MKKLLANNLTIFLIVIVTLTAVIAPISQFIDTQVGGKELIRVSKDIAVYLALLGSLLVAFKTHKKDLLQLFMLPINQLVLVFITLNLLYFFAFQQANQQAAAAGLLFNTRLFAWFGLVQLAVLFDKQVFVRFRKAIVSIGLFLVTFGLVQALVLPADFFSFVGYEYASGLSYQTVDNDPNLPRFASTTRGPNEFGAYLVIFIGLLSSSLLERKKFTLKKIIVTIAGLVCLYFTYSRSAVVGLVALAGLLSYKLLSKKQLMIAVLSIFVASAALLALSGQSQFVQRLVFHDENNSQELDSNEIRINKLSSSIEEITTEPFGQGLGSSGPASFYDQPSIPDNYYLQIATELGVTGLILFFMIYVSALAALFKTDYGLFAVGVGLGIIAFFNHLWTDDLVAFAFWGLTAISIAKHKQKLLPSTA